MRKAFNELPVSERTRIISNALGRFESEVRIQFRSGEKANLFADVLEQVIEDAYNFGHIVGETKRQN